VRKVVDCFGAVTHGILRFNRSVVRSASGRRPRVGKCRAYLTCGTARVLRDVRGSFCDSMLDRRDPVPKIVYEA
jgi:hypothetical protein